MELTSSAQAHRTLFLVGKIGLISLDQGGHPPWWEMSPILAKVDTGNDQRNDAMCLRRGCQRKASLLAARNESAGSNERSHFNPLGALVAAPTRSCERGSSF